MAMASSSVLVRLSRTLTKSAMPLAGKSTKNASTNQLINTKAMLPSTSFMPLRNMHSQPKLIGFSFPEEYLEEDDFITLHQESMERWKNEAANLRAIMIMDDIETDQDDPAKIASLVDHQVKSLYEELIDDNLLDPRLLWTASAN